MDGIILDSSEKWTSAQKEEWCREWRRLQGFAPEVDRELIEECNEETETNRSTN